MSNMLSEIHQQPEVIGRLVSRQADVCREVANAIEKKGCKVAFMAARGTSDNAATFGKYLFEIVNGIPVGLAAPSVYTLYQAKMKFDSAVVFGISQSGQSVDVNEYLENARRDGALTIGITNVCGSDIYKVSDYVILCEAEEEKSVAATKSYTSTLGAFILLSGAVEGSNRMADELLQAADSIKIVLQQQEVIKSVVERYRYMQECYTVARGINHATAYEIALKIAETCYVSAKPFSAADLMHGPIAVVREEYPCFLIAPSGKTLEMMRGLVHSLEERKAEIIAISDDDVILDAADTPLQAPAIRNEIFTPIVYVVFGQLFAYYLSVCKGHNPDQPRGLKKVTITR